MNESRTASLESEAPVKSRLFLLIVIRFAVCFLGLLYLNFSYIRTFSSIRPHYITLFTGCGINLIWLIWLGYGGWYGLLSFSQIFVDLILEGLIVYLTGGVFFSVFSFLFFATVLYTPLFTRPRYGLLSASLATVILSVISIIYFLSSEISFQLPYVPQEYTGRFSQQLNIVLPYLASFGISLHLVGYLAGHLVRRVGLQEFLTREILENMRDGVGAVDTEGRLYLLNEIARHYLNVDRKEFGNPLSLNRLKPEKFWSSVQTLVQEGKGGRWDVSIPHRDESEVHLEITLSNEPVRLPSHISQENVYFLFLRDITPRVEAEHHRRRAEKLKTVSNIGASIAHEIRNPLSSIQGAIQKVRNDRENDRNNGKNDRLLEIMQRESERVNRIIDGFLDFSQDEHVERTEVQARSLLDDVVEMIKHADTEKEVNVELDLQEDLTLSVDRDQIKQVFYNLILNGIEHAREEGSVIIRGKKESRRTLAKEVQGAHSSYWTRGTTFEILDDGTGIPEEDLNHMFEPFYSSTDEGTGLGLAVSSQIVHRHDGTIDAQRRPSGGTCITMWIPDEHVLPSSDQEE